jgi:hypothetical protein
MNAYNPLESMKRLEAAGVEAAQAEAIAAEIALMRNARAEADHRSIAGKPIFPMAFWISAVVIFAAAILIIAISIK